MRTRALREGELVISGGGKVDQVHLITVRWQPKKRVVIQRTRLDGTSYEGNSVEDDGPPKAQDLEVRVAIDMQALAEELGRKAFFSKGRKAKEAGGLVVVTVEKIR